MTSWYLEVSADEEPVLLDFARTQSSWSHTYNSVKDEN